MVKHSIRPGKEHAAVARQLWSLILLVLILTGQAWEVRGRPAPETASATATPVTVLRIRLSEGLRGRALSVRIDGAEVYRQSGTGPGQATVSALTVEVPAALPMVRLEVALQGGAQVARDIMPGHTPFVEVNLVDDALYLLPLEAVPLLM
jgi:hypothetical protein